LEHFGRFAGFKRGAVVDFGGRSVFWSVIANRKN